jgi:beta-ribofuranosylaminobenzene 5'-phosphate synthase
LLPSRLIGPGPKAPLLIASAFPAWPILMVMPRGKHIHGPAEADFFYSTLPIPLAEAQKTAHTVLMNLAPSVVEADYHAFCRALNCITFDTYFKQRQIELQDATVHTLINEARRNGIDAIGMSSMGPGCFSFTRAPRRAVGWLKELRKDGIVSDFWFTRAANQPARVERIPLWDFAEAAE